MVDSFLLKEDGDYLLLETGGTDKLILEVAPPITDIPKKSISHTTLDAGVDLRKKKAKPRQIQKLKLTVEVRATGNARVLQNVGTPTTGKARLLQKIVTQTQGTAKIVTNTSVKSHGPLRQKQVTAVPAQGKKGIRPVIDMLKQALRELED